jgi:hypothetical protein
VTQHDGDGRHTNPRSPAGELLHSLQSPPGPSAQVKARNTGIHTAHRTTLRNARRLANSPTTVERAAERPTSPPNTRSRFRLPSDLQHGDDIDEPTARWALHAEDNPSAGAAGQLVCTHMRGWRLWLLLGVARHRGAAKNLAAGRPFDAARKKAGDPVPRLTSRLPFPRCSSGRFSWKPRYAGVSPCARRRASYARQAARALATGACRRDRGLGDRWRFALRGADLDPTPSWVTRRRSSSSCCRRVSRYSIGRPRCGYFASCRQVKTTLGSLPVAPLWSVSHATVFG